MIMLLTAKPLQDLEEAVEAKNSALFMQAYDSLTEGYNACHSNHDYGFITIQRPTAPAWTNLRYRP
jgi:hypothetical protein